MTETTYEYLTDTQKLSIAEVLLNLANRGCTPEHISGIRDVLVKELGSLNYKPALH